MGCPVLNSEYYAYLARSGFHFIRPSAAATTSKNIPPYYVYLPNTPKEVKDAAGAVTQYAYDGYGRIISKTDLPGARS